MSDGAVGLLVLVAISIGSAAAWHFKFREYAIAAGCAAATSVVVFQVVAYLQAGYLDPFFPIAVVTSSLLSFAIALIVGIPFWQRRRRALAEQSPPSSGDHAP